MGDVANILGVAPSRPAASVAAASRKRPQAKKPEGMSRELFSLIGGEGPLPPILPSAGAAPKFAKKNASGAAAGRWVWARFSNSARQDGLQLSHWQRADTVFSDYPFARFNRACFVAQYTDDQYKAHVESIPPPPGTKPWSREDTDALFKACADFDLRWPVIADRWDRSPARSATELKARYYTVAKHVLQAEAATDPRASPTSAAASACNAAAGSNGSDSAVTSEVTTATDTRVSAKAAKAAKVALIELDFDCAAEELRQSNLAKQFSRTKEEEEEENRLVGELRRIEVQLRRIAKEAHARQIKQEKDRRMRTLPASISAQDAATMDAQYRLESVQSHEIAVYQSQAQDTRRTL